MDINYLMRKPEVITPKTQLLVMLHGYGSNEEDLFSFVPTLPEDWLIVSFRAPKETPYGGYSWYDIDFSNADRFIDKDEAIDMMKNILNHIRDIKEEYQLTERTHLMGFSQGGILSYSMALTYPELFNKIAILSAYPENKILHNISKDKKLYPICVSLYHMGWKMQSFLWIWAEAQQIYFMIWVVFSLSENTPVGITSTRKTIWI